MDNLTSENQFILDLFNLDQKDVKSIRFSKIADNYSQIDVTLEPHYPQCPECGFNKPKIKNYVPKKINHSVLDNRKTVILYNARRYVCPICGRTYYELNPFVFRSMKISADVVMNVLQELKDFNETFSSVARRYNISPTSVCSIFDQHVQLSRTKLPEVLSVDEVYAFRSPSSKYVCMFLDFVTQEPVDVLPSRRYDDLYSYFGKIPEEERRNVKLLCSDMYDTYRSIASSCFPDCRVAVDYFHLSQEFHRKMNDVRIRIMKGCSKDSNNYYLLKKFNWMLFKNGDEKDKQGEIFDPNREKIYNRHYKTYLNLYDIREYLLNVDQELTEAYNLKLELTEFYKTNTYESAKLNINDFIQKFHKSSVVEMNMFGRTLVKWKEEIINSFIIVKYDYKIDKDTGHVVVHNRKINNSIIENRNKIIKNIKHNANGYSNWFRFRNRLLYVLRPGATFHLEPLDVPWKKKE